MRPNCANVKKTVLIKKIKDHQLKSKKKSVIPKQSSIRFDLS